MSTRVAVRAVVPDAAREVLRRGRRARRIGPRRPPADDWRVPVDGRAPRLGTRELIGHDVRAGGAWEGRDPLRVPRLWSRPSWVAFLGWLLALGGSGWLSWRKHGGRDAFGE